MITEPPWPRSTIGGTAALIVFHTPVRLTAIISSHTCSSSSSAGPKLADAGVGHHDVDVAELADALGHDALELPEVAHVGLAGHDAPVELLDELGRVGQIVRRRQGVRHRLDRPAQVDGDDLGPLLGQPDSVRTALTRAAPVMKATLPSMRPMAFLLIGCSPPKS